MYLKEPHGDYSSSAATPAFDLTPADELFAALDGRAVTVDGVQWRLEIAGIHQQFGKCWVQVTAAGPGQHRLASTFEIDPAQPAELLDAVPLWLSAEKTCAINRFVTAS